ncbi:MAG: hypothetical protein ACE5I1_29360, partial [bacterium]
MNRLSIGFLSEKDPEESRLDDFTASYLSFKPLGENSQIIVGNFAIQNGAGLVFAGPFGLSVLSQPRRAVSFSPTRTLPYRTTGENMAFKGGVLMHAFPQFQIVIMHSNVKRDAHMTEDNQVSSRPVDGLHVTDGQIAARNTLGEASTGVIVNFMPKSNFKIGANVLSQRFNHSILPKDTIRQKFAFRGNTNTLYGVNLCFITPDQRISIVGETAICEKGAAAVIGLNLNLGRTIFTSGYWFADPGFHNTYGALPGNRVGDMANQRAPAPSNNGRCQIRHL